MEMTIAEWFLLAWALAMTYLWRITIVRYEDFEEHTFNTLDMFLDGKGKFVKVSETRIHFEEL
jgi:hypothetical protein